MPCTSKTGARGSQPRHRTRGARGITGATKAGKSCLLHLVAGFDSEFAGSIRRHGRAAHLGHKPWLMNDTIRNNILFGQPLARRALSLGARRLRPHGRSRAAQPRDQTLVGSSAPASPAASSSGSPWPAPPTPGPISCCWTTLCLRLDPMVAAQVLEQGSPSSQGRPGSW